MIPSPSPHSAALQHLPPHLREVCALLAAGLLRLRSRAAEELARDAAEARDRGEVRLHSAPGSAVMPTRLVGDRHDEALQL